MFTKGLTSKKKVLGLFNFSQRQHLSEPFKMTLLEKLRFDNLALLSLPVEPGMKKGQRQVEGACFSRVKPTPVSKPEVVAVSRPALSLIDLTEEDISHPTFAEYFSGNKLLPGSDTAAHCYCGHQFGHFSGQLGDGAAIYLGEILNKDNERWEIQLKGAGLTPFSRTADGRKVLRSSIREFLCSEAMHHLGIPTSRAGSCVTSKSMVVRDIFYNGNAIQEKATIVMRMAQTFIRFGSFEICKDTDPETGRKGPSVGQHDVLLKLLDYVVKTFYPQIWDSHPTDKKPAYLEFYKDIVKRTASLVAKWQSIGWCHGVLNTDNMSIVGVTIDYGPYGFIDSFDPNFICNNSDDGGRYAYSMQPEICKWNCLKLAQSLNPIVGMEDTRPLLEHYDEEYSKEYTSIMRKKFGLLKQSSQEDEELVKKFFDTMQKTGADFTNSFRSLSMLPLPGSDNFQEQMDRLKERLVEQSCTVEQLKQKFKPRIDPRQLQMYMMMMQMNPSLLAQMGKGQEVITQELERIEKSKQIDNLKAEDKKADDEKLWSEWLKLYSVRLEKEAGGMNDLPAANQYRKTLMNNTNPRFILRNYIAQNAIEAAENGDYSEVNNVLKLLENPYSEDPDLPTMTKPADLASQNKDAVEGASAAPASMRTGGALSNAGVAYDSKPPVSANELRVT